MQILALETSTEHGGCALWRDGEVLEKFCPAGRSHSETLLPLVRELLAEAGTAVGRLDGISFGVGPGAFTGLRVACGAAQGLAVACDLPVLPVTSLACMAAACGGSKVMSLLDARMGEVYVASYENRPEGPLLLDEIRVVVPAAITWQGGADSWLACGNALRAYPELAERLQTEGSVLRPDVLPLPAWVARLAAPALRDGKGIDPALAVPLYIRDKVAKTVAERLSEGGRA